MKNAILITSFFLIGCSTAPASRSDGAYDRLRGLEESKKRERSSIQQVSVDNMRIMIFWKRWEF